MTPLSILLILGLAGILPACAAPSKPARSGVNTGLSTLADPAADRAALSTAAGSVPSPSAETPQDTATWAAQAALDLQRVLDERGGSGRSPGPASGRAFGAPAADAGLEAAPSESGLDVHVRRLGQDETSPAAPAPSITASAPLPKPPADENAFIPPSPPGSPAERRRALATELATALREGAGAADAPFSEYLALAGLEATLPGVLGEGETGALSPGEAQSLAAVRDLITGLGSGQAAGGDPSKLADLLEEIADRLAGSQPLRIRKAALCTSVQGFGRYTPLASDAFLAGRAHRVIVYVEVDRFSSRQDSDGWLVELSQELNLFHDADSMLAWRKPEQQIRDAARTRLNDFYLIHDVTLPESLTVGSYRLKIAMKDKATGAVDETTLPIRVVADPALVRGGGRR